MSAIERLSNKVIDFVVVRRPDTENNSPRMEVVGVERLLDRLFNRGLTIRSVTTDRSTAITALMRRKYPDVRHYHDPWHSIQSFRKKLRPVSSFFCALRIFPVACSVGNLSATLG